VKRRQFVTTSLAASVFALAAPSSATGSSSHRRRNYAFHRTISREVLENYLSRSITMSGMMNGGGDLNDNVSMLKRIGAQYLGRSICLWGGESKLLANFERARQQMSLARTILPDAIFEACIFEIVSTEVEQVPVPEWAFTALGLPVEKRNFRYEAMLYPLPQRTRSWDHKSSVPDVSQTETQIWFYYLAKTYIDLGFEGIHWGQMEIMNYNDPHLDHYARIFQLVRAYAVKHARRGMILCNAHTPSGGLVRDGELLLDFHALPLRIKEVSDKAQEATLEVGFVDSMYLRSKGGRTYSGWTCEHLPYLVEFDNWGVAKYPGQSRQTAGRAVKGAYWLWGYDEISWFANQKDAYRRQWLRYAWTWVRKTDPNGFLEMPGRRGVTSPLNHLIWYAANRPSPAAPEGMGDEDTIYALWNDDRGQHGLKH
jgi:hypothetical protein